MRLGAPTFVCRAVLAFASAVFLSCGGGSPTAPPTTPPAPPGHTVNVMVFYDENGNGALESSEEHIRIPDVEVHVGGRSARSGTGGGVATIANVPAGTHAITIRADTGPPFFVVTGAPSVSVPQADGNTARLALGLPIGNNRPNVYMAFGDSITRGDGAPTGASYPAKLQAKLIAHFGGAQVNNRGADATNSFEALERLNRNIEGSSPAYTLIHYGTNDWHDPVCQETPPCHTVANLRTLVRRVKATGSLPFLATIIPAHPTEEPGRVTWLTPANEGIRAMAREEGAFLVDLNMAFQRQTDMTRLFADHVHPNEAGYEVIAEGFFQAIAHGRSVP